MIWYYWHRISDRLPRIVSGRRLRELRELEEAQKAAVESMASMNRKERRAAWRRLWSEVPD